MLHWGKLLDDMGNIVGLEIIVFGFVGVAMGCYTAFSITCVYKYFYSKHAEIIKGGLFISIFCLGWSGMLIIKYFENESNGVSANAYYSLFVSLVVSFVIGSFFFFDTWKIAKKINKRGKL